MSQNSVVIDANYVASKLKEWSEKSNKPIDELKGEYQRFLTQVEGRTDSIKYKKALNLLLKTFTTSMKSTAVTYDVILLGASAPQDMVAKRRRDLLKKYETSAAECIAEGSVRLEGGVPVLIDINKTWPGGSENYGYGKPIPEHSWMTTVFAVAKKPGEDQKWMPATLILRDELAVGALPLFKEMSTRLNGKYSTEQSKYLLNGSKAATKFDNIIRDVPAAEIAEIVDTVYANKFVFPEKLQEEFEATKGDFNRFVVTEATLNRHYLNPNGISSIELIDQGLDFGKTITGFVDENIKSILEGLEDGETVGVIAKLSLMAEKDENRQATGEQILGMNVYSVFPRPE